VKFFCSETSCELSAKNRILPKVAHILPTPFEQSHILKYEGQIRDQGQKVHCIYQFQKNPREKGVQSKACKTLRTNR
jgi:hypothetical protein